jgi:hypothetical protein
LTALYAGSRCGFRGLIFTDNLTADALIAGNLLVHGRHVCGKAYLAAR